MPYPIEVQEVWKSYLRGSGAYRYQTLRDTLAAGASRLIGRKRVAEPRTRFWALKDVSFKLGEGETTGLIGRNGAGKTTMLKVIARITRPTKGRALIRGRVGSLLEVGTGFHPELTGRENVLFNGAVLGMRRAEVLRKFDDIVEFAEIADFIDSPVKRYSSGMSMRLAFSVAAHLEPEVMLVDEVLAVGDNEFQRRCLNRIIDIAQEGRTVVFVSHNMGTVERVCTRAILLRDGEVVADGPAQDVVHQYHGLESPEEIASQAISLENLEAPKFFRWRMESAEALGEYSLFSGAPCTLSFTLAVPRRIPDAFIGMGIWTDQNVLAMALSGYDLAGDTVDLERGIYDVSFSVPALHLGRGRYHIRASLTQYNGATVASWNAAPGLEVVRRRESKQLPPPNEGVFVTDGSFGLSPVPLSSIEVSGADVRG